MYECYFDIHVAPTYTAVFLIS